jgi:hypothetical protein
MPWLPNIAGPFRNHRAVSVNPASISANSTGETSVAWKGVDANSVVFAIAPSLGAGLVVQNPCKCTTDTVVLRIANVTGSSIDPPAQEVQFIRF